MSSIKLSDDEKIIVNTGLGLMYQLIDDKAPFMDALLEDHPYKELLTLDNIDKLHYKFELNNNNNNKSDNKRNE